ncbi:MAG: amino acid ABC transporter substrate-binding protein [Cyanophyceae cyanobacterium]
MIKLPAILLGMAAALVPLSAVADVLEEIRETSELRVGIRVDAAPFGFVDANGDLAGYCLRFVNLLRQQVKQALNKDVLLVRLYRSSTANRFSLVDDRIAYLECGPNTIRNNLPDSVEFSEPFFVTGTQFLVRKEDRVDPSDNLAEQTIGVLQGTTTEALLANLYPQADVRTFRGAAGRTRGVEALSRGQIDAFVSDGILLLGEVAQQNLSLSSYELTPPRPLTCDRYGMILPANDPQWRNLVNATIESQRSQQILEDYFEDIAAVGETEEACQ